MKKNLSKEFLKACANATPTSSESPGANQSPLPTTIKQNRNILQKKETDQFHKNKG